jgi:hypothetical protein
MNAFTGGVAPGYCLSALRAGRRAIEVASISIVGRRTKDHRSPKADFDGTTSMHRVHCPLSLEEIKELTVYFVRRDGSEAEFKLSKHRHQCLAINQLNWVRTIT